MQPEFESNYAKLILIKTKSHTFCKKIIIFAEIEYVAL